MQWALRWVSLERINTCQYLTFSLTRALQCLIHPGRAELIEIKHEGRREQLRLFSGLLINFDFPQLPFQGDCAIDEPRLVLCLIPQAGRRQALATLLAWPKLDSRLRKYEITPGKPVEILFLENDQTRLALDEDTFTAPSQLRFDVAALVRFVSGALPEKVAYGSKQPPLWFPNSRLGTRVP
jgi:hypothetical protein